MGDARGMMLLGPAAAPFREGIRFAAALLRRGNAFFLCPCIARLMATAIMGAVLIAEGFSAAESGQGQQAHAD